MWVTKLSFYSLSLLTPLQPDTPLRNTLDNSDLARSLLSLALFVHPEHTTLVQRRPGPIPASTDSPSSSTDSWDSVLPPPHRTPTPSTETRRLTGRRRSHELDRYQTGQQEERASWNHLWYVCACFLLLLDRPERLSGRCLTPHVLSPVPRDGTGGDSAPSLARSPTTRHPVGGVLVSELGSDRSTRQRGAGETDTTPLRTLCCQLLCVVYVYVFRLTLLTYVRTDD